MSNSPFFSVVIPTYNRAFLLKNAIESVVSQTFLDYEIIVVDNSSTDETDFVVKNFNNSNIRLIKINNGGIIALSRNEGIHNSNGKWIAFLDSDDVWLPHKLEKVHAAINNNEDYILFCHNEWHIINGEKVSRLVYGCNGADLYTHLLFKGNCMSTSAVCISKEVALKTKGFSSRKDFVTVEDYEYWIRLSKEGKI